MREKGWSQNRNSTAGQGSNLECVWLAQERHRAVESRGCCVTVWMLEDIFGDKEEKGLKSVKSEGRRLVICQCSIQVR